MINIVNFLKAIADETRIRIISLIKYDEICVCKLMEILDMPQSTLSHHISILKNAGIIDAEKRGKWIYYSLNKKNVNNEKQNILNALYKSISKEKIVISDLKDYKKSEKQCK